MKDRKKRNIIMGSLCALLVFMGIGYAIISQMLTIKGVSTVAGDWNIYIDSITPNAIGTGVSVSESVGLDKVSASFEANLYAPGDKVEYKVVVKNDGNIDAKLGAVNQHVSNDTDDIVKYSNTLENGYILRHGESFVFYVTTELPEELEELPENTVRAVLDLKLNFTQYTGGGSGEDPLDSPIQIISGDINTPGSEIAIGTEQFYVVPNMEGDGDDKVSLLSKYNLLVGNDYSLSGFEVTTTYTNEDANYNKQSESAKGLWCENWSDINTCSINSTVPFASLEGNLAYWSGSEPLSYLEKYNLKGNQIKNYVYDEDEVHCTISEYVKKYKEILEEDYSIDIADAKLLSYEQALALGCSGYSCSNAPSWFFGTSFWLGSSGDDYFVWFVLSSNQFETNTIDTDFFEGVRPVIVLDKELFN